jgi:hypothetical protein
MALNERNSVTFELWLRSEKWSKPISVKFVSSNQNNKLPGNILSDVR